MVGEFGGEEIREKNEEEVKQVSERSDGMRVPFASILSLI